MEFEETRVDDGAIDARKRPRPRATAGSPHRVMASRMIPNMHIPTQRNHPVARRMAPCIVPVLATLALSACLQPDSGAPPDNGAPDRVIARPPTHPASDAGPHANPDPGPTPPAPEPLDPWVFATSPEEFHAIWRARFEHATAENATEEHLLPYADALEHHGAAWGFSPRDGLWMHIPTRDAAYPVPDAAHTRLDPQNTRDDLAPDPHFDAATVRMDYHGATLRMRGPLVTDPSCAKCHDFEPGALAGELVYEFTEIADD